MPERIRKAIHFFKTVNVSQGYPSKCHHLPIKCGNVDEGHKGSENLLNRFFKRWEALKACGSFLTGPIGSPLNVATAMREPEIAFKCPSYMVGANCASQNNEMAAPVKN